MSTVSVVLLAVSVTLLIYSVTIVVVLWLDSKGKSTIAYTPRGDRVIVKRLPLPAPKPGEVFIPDSQRKPLNEGTIIAMGPKITDLSVGDHICFLDYAGSAIEVDGEEYLSMRDEEIHGRRGNV